MREEILEASRGLFQKFGLDKTTMEDIAEAAGKGKSTLYYYFKSKEDVFYAVASAEMRKATDEIALAVSACKSSTEKMLAFFKTRADILSSKAKLYPIIFKEQKKHIEFFHKIQRETNMTEITLLKEILLKGIASGEFKSIKKEECDALAITGVTALHGMYTNLILEGEEIPSETDKMNLMARIFVRGLK